MTPVRTKATVAGRSVGCARRAGCRAERWCRRRSGGSRRRHRVRGRPRRRARPRSRRCAVWCMPGVVGLHGRGDVRQVGARAPRRPWRRRNAGRSRRSRVRPAGSGSWRLRGRAGTARCRWWAPRRVAAVVTCPRSARCGRGLAPGGTGSRSGRGRPSDRNTDFAVLVHSGDHSADLHRRYSFQRSACSVGHGTIT